MNPFNAAPYTYFNGIDDESTRAQTIDPVATPTHLPLMPIYAAWGPDASTPTIESASSLASTYGADSFNPRLPFFTHQSQFLQTIQGEGNQVMVARLIPADAGPKARLLLSLDIVADAIPQYQRNSSGQFILDATGAKIPVTGVGATMPGFKAKWVVNQWTSTGEVPEVFGACQSRTGTLLSSTSVQSTLYPILELEATFVGSKGNNLGIRLVAPTAQTNPPLNEAQADRVKSALYLLQMIQRESPTSNAVVIPAQDGSQAELFSFRSGAFDINTDQNLDLAAVNRVGYSNHSIPGNPPVYGPFENVQVYTEYLETVLAMIGAAEAPMGTLPENPMAADSEWLYAVNPFTAASFDGVPYYTLSLASPLSGGTQFTAVTNLWATGASDGTMTAQGYDADVGNWASAWANGSYPQYQDMAKYPFTFLYDSGFSLATKKLLVPVLGQRPDLAMILATQSVLDPQNTPAADSSMAQALMATLSNYPESTLYGTAVCRAMIVGSSGYLLNSNYTGLLPLSLQVAKRFAAYMGAGNSLWNSSVPPDENPYNVVDMFTGVNSSYKTALARSGDWTTGLVWVENFDMNTQYFPALASVYNNDTSILKGFLNVAIAVDLIRIAHAARRQLSGISGLTDGQFVKRSNAIIASMVKGRYDGRVAVVPNTFFSTQDQANGYSWSVEIQMYGNNMRTVGSATIVARRMSDLPTGQTGG